MLLPHVHVVLTALAVAGCAKSPKDSTSGTRSEPEAPGPAPAESRFSGTVAGHRFTIAIESGRVVHRGPDTWSWKLGAGEVSIEELGPADADTHFLVERSPRTIVRGDDGFSIVTEVVLVAGGRAFRCAHEERVDDPDSPAARAAVERGVVACSSLRIEP
ncbi:MAG TPA: hypothetical protein VN253_20790 [Kofleriaceae bacterium]|nr:hypothetical protein [Kofleriaceae bacterium]